MIPFAAIKNAKKLNQKRKNGKIASTYNTLVKLNAENFVCVTTDTKQIWKSESSTTAARCQDLCHATETTATDIALGIEIAIDTMTVTDITSAIVTVIATKTDEANTTTSATVTLSDIKTLYLPLTLSGNSLHQIYNHCAKRWKKYISHKTKIKKQGYKCDVAANVADVFYRSSAS